MCYYMFDCIIYSDHQQDTRRENPDLLKEDSPFTFLLSSLKSYNRASNGSF